VISHPLVKPGPRGDPRGSIQVPDLKAIRALVAQLFPPTGTLPVAKYQVPASSGKPSGSGVSNCADAPRPTPTPKPTPNPTPKPSATPAPTATPTPTPEPSVEAEPSA
jgi:hypothetical protein